LKRNLGAGTLSPNGINLLFGDQRKLRILALLRQRGPMTRAEISRATGIAKSSISVMVEQLAIDHSVQILRATSGNRSGSVKGRPGELVEIDPSSGAAIGIELSKNKMRGVIGDLSHEILSEFEVPLVSNYSFELALKTAQDMVSHLLSITRITPSRIIGIGVGVAAVVYLPAELESQESLTETILDERFVKELSEITGFTTTLENSANLAAYAELLWGNGFGLRDFLYFKADHFIGGAVVISQEVITGSLGGAGEFGHLILDPQGPVCRCGQRGCLDTYSSIQAMTSSASLTFGHEVDLTLFKQLIENGDSVVTRILHDSAEKLGQAASVLARVLNPEQIIFSGDLIDLHPDVMLLITKKFKSHMLPINTHVKLSRGSLGDQASSLGGVALILGQNS
jgi:predicted NBD/HSP70 family sugar kinase